MANKNELLPCPFCGGEGIVKSRSLSPLKPETRYGVMCDGDCGVFLDERAKTVMEAIAAWNRRAYPSAPADRELVAEARRRAVSPIQQVNDWPLVHWSDERLFNALADALEAHSGTFADGADWQRAQDLAAVEAVKTDHWPREAGRSDGYDLDTCDAIAARITAEEPAEDQ